MTRFRMPSMSLLAILGCAACSDGGRESPSSIPMDPIWKSTAPLPAGLAGFAHTAIGPTLVIAGGTRWENDVKHTLSAVVVYDPATNTWSEGSPLPRPFAFGPFGTFEGRLFAAGGDDGERTRSDIVGLASPLVLPAPAAYAGGALWQGRLHVLGGTPDLRDLSQTHARFHALNFSSGQQEQLPDFPGGPAIHIALTSLDDGLLAFTGGRWDADSRRLVNMDEAWRYDPGKRTWTRLPPYPFPARGVAACALDDRHVLLAGGYRSFGDRMDVTAECFLYDAVRDRYLPLPPLPVEAMTIGLLRDNDTIYMIGGEDRPRTRSAAVYRASISDLLKSAGAARDD